MTLVHVCACAYEVSVFLFKQGGYSSAKSAAAGCPRGTDYASPAARKIHSYTDIHGAIAAATMEFCQNMTSRSAISQGTDSARSTLTRAHFLLSLSQITRGGVVMR